MKKVIKIMKEDKRVLFAGKLIESSYKPPCENAAVVIENGIINKIIYNTDFNNLKRNFNDYRIIDLSNLTLMAGFIDCHVHLALDGINFQKAVEQWDCDELLFKRLKREFKNYLEKGILAIRDGGDRRLINITAKEKCKRERLDAPIILASGFALNKKGMYGSFLGEGILNNEDIKNSVEILYQKGVDQIKVLMSGIVSFKEYGRVGSLQFSLEEAKEIVNEARRHNLKVMAHASSAKAVDMAIKADMDSIEHGYFLSEEALDIMAKKEIPWIPTLVPVANQLKEDTRKFYTEKEIENIEKTLDSQLIRVKQAQEKGVILGIGTDAGASGTYHAISYFEELRLFEKAGLSPTEIFKAATENSAKIVGLEDKMGGIEKGKLPNLMALEGNPLRDISSYEKIKYVFITEI
ncbi:MAG: amidohydrolase family protein [Thermoanaerobacteraceae bacterium]|nr:amidohydrolase family protein [Thermoanaerobacteraceae bacterium]